MPAEQRDDDGNIVPFNHLWVHLADARGMAHRLTALQLAAELDAVAARQRQVTSRYWDQAVIEEAAQRLRGVDGSLRGQA
jgi:hypothetical protein